MKKPPITLSVRHWSLVGIEVRRGKQILLSGSCEPKLALELEQAVRAALEQSKPRRRRR